MIFQAAKSGHWFQIPNFFSRLKKGVANPFTILAVPQYTGRPIGGTREAPAEIKKAAPVSRDGF